MAACTDYTCSHCGFQIEAWSDGHLYLKDSTGKRHYFYHPGEYWGRREFYQQQTGCHVVDEAAYQTFCDERGGYEADLICLHCGRQTRRDPERDSMRCTGCRRNALHDTYELEGLTCPKCGKGTFHGEFTGAIS